MTRSRCHHFGISTARIVCRIYADDSNRFVKHDNRIIDNRQLDSEWIAEIWEIRHEDTFDKNTTRNIKRNLFHIMASLRSVRVFCLLLGATTSSADMRRGSALDGV